MGWTTWRGDELKNLIVDIGLSATKKSADEVLKLAHTQVPLKEGTLQKSGKVVMAPGRLPIAIITYGGGVGTGYPIVPYAVRWHENNANFQKGRKMRYLADPFNMLLPRVLEEAIEYEKARLLV